jgi:hypothetical protein
MKRWSAPWSGLIAGFLFAACTAVAPTAAQQTTSGDAPPLIAGRVTLAEGDAQIWRVEEDSAGEWDQAVVNDVVSVGTGLYTGNDGRNEIRVGPHTLRLSSASRGGFSQLDYNTAVFNLEYGVLNLRLARPEHGEVMSVTAAGGSFDLTGPGRYRIDADERGPVRVTVFEGHATVRAGAQSLGVSSGQAATVDASAGPRFEQAVATAFDQWALARDANYSNVRSSQYVSQYMTGYEDLDASGDWITDVNYGAVWAPRVVPVGWAPYRYGQWRWVRPWGWTWVDHARWGYAPFHYGRWVYLGHRWCWWPGGYVRRPVWGPAFVGFVGGSSSIWGGVGGIWGGVRGPVVGWYPLAPWHRYQPHYRHSPTYVTVINQTIIQSPPPGVPPTVNHSPGATMVPGPRFRDPVMKVALQVQPKAEELKPVAPPPVNVAPAPRSKTRKYADEGGGSAPAASATPAPGQLVKPPTRVSPPMVAEPIPGRGVAPQKPLPGNDPAPLAQPPGMKRDVVPAPAPQARTAPAPFERPTPKPHIPSNQLPAAQQPTNPNEPARFPPGAPPTIKQPMAPAARPVQPSPTPVVNAPAAPRAAPAPREAPVPREASVPRAALPAQPAPPVVAAPPAPRAAPVPREAPVPRAAVPAQPAPPVVAAPPAPRAAPAPREAPVPRAAPPAPPVVAAPHPAPPAAVPPPRPQPTSKEQAVREAQDNARGSGRGVPENPGNERGGGPGRGKQP